jgi:iron complex outermembrane receptor protein
MFEQDLWSFAVYGGFGWDFLDDFTLDAGVRYNWERKTFAFEQHLIAGANSDIAVPQDETWSAPTALVSLKYRFSTEVAAYMKYSRGWKGGHYNANRLNLPDPPDSQPVDPVKPETLDSIEVGLRGSWLDARLFMSGAFFYYKYQDYQLFLFSNAPVGPPILEIVNANNVESYGMELELNARPIEDVDWVPPELGGLDLTLRFGWLESHFLDFVNLIQRQDPAPPFTTFQQQVSYTGNRLPNAPQLKLSGGVNWPFELGSFGTLTPRYDFDWTDDVFFGPGEGQGTSNILDELLPELTIGQPAFARHNLRLSYVTPDGMLEISGWVRNIGDAAYKTYAFDASIFAAVVINFIGEPRTGGADITIRF